MAAVLAAAGAVKGGEAMMPSEQAAHDGYVDDIVDTTALRSKIISALNMLGSKRVATLPKKHTGR